MPSSPTKTDARALRAPRPRRKPPTPRAVATALRIQAARNGYEISVSERDALFDAQSHRCAVCNRPFRTPRWHLECTFTGKLEGRRIQTPPHVDHDHSDGHVRGITCGFCNRYVLPMVERFPEWVAQARVYVLRGGWAATMGSDVTETEGSEIP